MMITEEMMTEDEKHWHARNIIAELGYCGKYIRHRKNITNDDLRFYAYIMRKACTLLKEQEAVKPIRINTNYEQSWKCGRCGGLVNTYFEYCPRCGRRVKWK